MDAYIETINDIALPPGAEGHFRLHVYAVVHRMLANLRIAGGNEGGYFDAFPFLSGYERSLRARHPQGLSDDEIDRWWSGQIADWERATSGHLPLPTLAATLGLDGDELRLLIAAGLVEEDIRFGALFAALQSPLHERRPCLGVLGWLLVAPGAPPEDAWPAASSLLHHNLLQIEDQSSPRADWTLRVPSPLWDALRGRAIARSIPGLELQPQARFPPLDALILAETLHRQLAGLPTLLANTSISALLLRGMAGSGRRTVAGALARALGRDLLVAEQYRPTAEAWRIFGPLATAIGAFPLLRCDPGPGEAIAFPMLAGYVGPVAIALGRSGGAHGPLVERALTLALPSPDAAERHRFWQRAAPELDDSTRDEVTARLLLNGGHIIRAAPLATAYAALDQRTRMNTADVRQAARSLSRQALETLATELRPLDGWADLVVSSSTADELCGLEARCQARERLQYLAGPAFAGGLNRGVRAMFSGPSGTGKTLAARALAGALQMDIYRVDLAAVVNKYIGETERNLNQVLSRAEELDVLLLLDEGDALMTSRTEVRSANDPLREPGNQLPSPAARKL